MSIAIYKEPEVEKCTLLEWVGEHHSEDEQREVFLNMDIALKYIHEHGYCIEVFHPNRIEVLDGQPDHIQFVNIMELPKDPTLSKDMIKEDIFNSSFVQIGIYTNTLRSLTPDFLRTNFDEIARFVPEGDIPYYRGVVQRGAAVYLSEYASEKAIRDLESLNRQLQESEGKTPTNAAPEHHEAKPLSNDRINDRIYRQINGFRDAAFISYLLIPTIAFVSLFIIAFISWLLSLL